MKIPVGKSFLVRLMLITSLFTAGSCAVNPVTGKKQVSLLSEKDEIAMGAESDPQVVAQFGLYDDPQIQSFIEKYGQQMAAISHRPQLKYHFKILDSPVVNAFAVPGGYVYFTRGIMAHFNNEAQFAGVLGHEIGHITARHGAQQYTKATLAQLGYFGGLALSKELRMFARETDMAMQLLFLKFSRDDESQSDKLGVEYSTKIGFDAHQMADFFQTLDKLSSGGDGEEIPGFLSTHPNPQNRYENVNKLATEWQASTGLSSYKVNRDSYLKMIDGIIYGEDPRQGYVSNNVFYHPELRFQFPVPDNWQLANSPSQVQMASSDGKGFIMVNATEGNSLQEVANQTAEANSLVVSSSRNITVNGLKALEVLSSITQQDPSTGAQSVLNIQSTYIQYGSLIYIFHGLSLAADFNKFVPTFDKVMSGFKELKDASKINVQPERIKIVEVKSSGTMASALSAYGIPTDRQRELAVLNGKDVKDQVSKGEKIKILTKDGGA